MNLEDFVRDGGKKQISSKADRDQICKLDFERAGSSCLHCLCPNLSRTDKMPLISFSNLVPEMILFAYQVALDSLQRLQPFIDFSSVIDTFPAQDDFRPSFSHSWMPSHPR
jgi:hypothetical protein